MAYPQALQSAVQHSKTLLETKLADAVAKGPHHRYILTITQKRSKISQRHKVRQNLLALGLKKINSTVVLPDTLQVRGQIDLVKHLISVEATPVLCTQPPPISVPPPVHFYPKMEPVRSIIKDFNRKIEADHADKIRRLKRRRAAADSPYRAYSPYEKERSQSRKKGRETFKAELERLGMTAKEYKKMRKNSPKS